MHAMQVHSTLRQQQQVCSTAADSVPPQRARCQATHLNLSFVCAAWFFADTCLLGTNSRVPPCSSPPRAGAQVGLWAVVMLRAAAQTTLLCSFYARAEVHDSGQSVWTGLSGDRMELCTVLDFVQRAIRDGPRWR